MSPSVEPTGQESGPDGASSPHGSCVLTVQSLDSGDPGEQDANTFGGSDITCAMEQSAERDPA